MELRGAKQSNEAPEPKEERELDPGGKTTRSTTPQVCPEQAWKPGSQNDVRNQGRNLGLHTHTPRKTNEAGQDDASVAMVSGVSKNRDFLGLLLRLVVSERPEGDEEGRWRGSPALDAR